MSGMTEAQAISFFDDISDDAEFMKQFKVTPTYLKVKDKLYYLSRTMKDGKTAALDVLSGSELLVLACYCLRENIGDKNYAGTAEKIIRDRLVTAFIPNIKQRHCLMGHIRGALHQLPISE